MAKDEIERDPGVERRHAKLHIEGVAQTFAANFLRVVRGAGRPADVLTGMQECIDAAHAYYAVHQIWPVYEVQEAIRHIQSERNWDVVPDHVIERRLAIDEIIGGALQIAASRLANQTTQERAGEKELRRGVKALEAVRAQRLKIYEAEHRAMMAAQKATATKPKTPQKLRSTKPIPR